MGILGCNSILFAVDSILSCLGTLNGNLGLFQAVWRQLWQFWQFGDSYGSLQTVRTQLWQFGDRYGNFETVMAVWRQLWQSGDSYDRFRIFTSLRYLSLLNFSDAYLKGIRFLTTTFIYHSMRGWRCLPSSALHRAAHECNQVRPTAYDTLQGAVQCELSTNF